MNKENCALKLVDEITLNLLHVSAFSAIFEMYSKNKNTTMTSYVVHVQ